MGFWHTGYMEFHEPIGLDQEWSQPRPRVYPCSHCEREFASPDELRQHRFEDHPIQRPVLFLAGRELGAQTIKISKPLGASAVSISNAEAASYNGEEIPVSQLPARLEQQDSGFVTIRLFKAGTQAEFSLEFQIADVKDLEGVEQQFLTLANSARLSLAAIESFIAGSGNFSTARIYLGGICHYLYGVLAKERSESSNLPYDSYISRFTKAAGELAGYDRPLAHSICALVEFHFNHFQEAYDYSPASRVGLAAGRYRDWLISGKRGESPEFSGPIGHTIDSLLTDPDTEQVLQWSVVPLAGLAAEIEPMRNFLTGDIADYDRKKVQVLLAETLRQNGNDDEALEIAKSLRNLPVLERWAESMIRASGRQGV